ncbi:MAG: sortase [Candidatus Paceibacterota bacterium]
MERIVEMTAQLVTGARLAYARMWSFLGLFAFIFLVSTVMLGALDLLPNALTTTADKTLATVASDRALATTSPAVRVEEPVKIEIPSLGLTATIANPTSTNVAVLDEHLLKGAVRYPTSAKLGESGNVVVFGHSSYLPVVINQAFKTFDGIQKLKQGDLVTVYSAGTAYTYSVRTMKKESANDAVIQLATEGKVLTLATCNSFGEKSDRFVVTADFVESHSIGA